jgi:hypothetical protein
MLCVLLAGSCALAQSVDELVSKNIAARGGAEKLAALKTVHMTGTLDLGQFKATLVSDNKRPDQMRMDMITSQFTATRAYDGKTGWSVMPQEGQPDPKPMNADDLKDAIEEAEFVGPLVDYKQKGHKLELLGHEAIDGRDCYKLKLTRGGTGEVRTIWLDGQTFLERRVEGGRKTDKGEESYVQNLDDYREVEGLKFPFKSVVEVNSAQGNGKYTYSVEKIELNKPMDNTRFEMPAAMPATQPGK